MAELRPTHLVYRIETRPDSALSGLRKHVRGGFSRETQQLPDLHQLAYGQPGGAIALRPSATPADMRKWRKEAQQARGRGKPPEPWCEAIFVGPQIIDWSPKQGRRWADTCVAEYERLMPHARIIEAQLHTRETAWHVHIVAQPRGIDQMDRLKCSKNAMIRTAIEIETGEPPPYAGRRGLDNHGEDCMALQDAFHRVCGEPFGLLRGERGSKAAHRELDDEHRAAAAAREAEELTKRRQAELDEIGDFRAARAKLAADEKRLTEDIDSFNAHMKKNRAAEKDLRERTAANDRRDQEYRERVRKYSAAADKLKEARAKAKRQIAVTNRCLQVVDACIAGDLSPDDTRDTLLAAKEGQPLPEVGKEAIRLVERQQQAAAKAAERTAEVRVSERGGMGRQ